MRLPSSAGPPSPAAFGGDLSPAGRGEGRCTCGAAGRAPSPLGGEGWGEGAGAFAGFAEGAACALAALAAAALTSSPSPASTAITALTGTSCVPSGTTILASVPSSTASTSMVALSVSISAITSPDLTLSPSFFSHLARLPFSMVGDSAGMRMLVGMVGASRSRLSRAQRSAKRYAAEPGPFQTMAVPDQRCITLGCTASGTRAKFHRVLTGNRPPSPPRSPRRPTAARASPDWPRKASARPCR